jgi:hypothetical protein
MSRVYRNPDAGTSLRQWLETGGPLLPRQSRVVLVMLLGSQSPYALSSILEEARVAEAKRHGCDSFPAVRLPLGQCQLPASDRLQEKFETPLRARTVVISVTQTNAVALKTRRSSVDWLAALGWVFDQVVSACKATSDWRIAIDEARPRRGIGSMTADLRNLRRGAGLRTTQLPGTVPNENRTLLANVAGRGKSTVLTWLLRGWMAYASRFKMGAEGDAGERSLRFDRRAATDGQCGLGLIGGAGTAGSAHAIVSPEAVSCGNDLRSVADSIFAGSERDRDLLTRGCDGACSGDTSAVAALQVDRGGGRLPRGSSRFAARPHRHDTHRVSADVRIRCRVARPADRHQPPRSGHSPSRRSVARAKHPADATPRLGRGHSTSV